ncbi:flagellar assembly protein T N-terminal domain-containing protein [Gammaproteobacteria bacterium AS21]
MLSYKHANTSFLQPSRYLYVLSIALCLILSTHATALTVQAQGQAYIVNGDITSARYKAIEKAKQQALLQSSAYISTQPQLEQGTLATNNLSAVVGDPQVINESRSGNLLNVLISVRINVENRCIDSKHAGQYRKRVAIAGFPLIHRKQANIGRLGNIESSIATELVSRLNHHANIAPLNAGRLMLQPDPSVAVTEQLAQGSLTSVLQQTRQLEVQYVVSGVVRDISMLTPTVFTQKNYFVDKYHKLDYLSSRYMRAFEVDLFIHDGFTGALVSQKSYRTGGLWGNNDRQKFGFASSPFWKLDYGQQVSRELDRMASDINSDIRCDDYSVEISRTHESKIWLKAGRSSGVKIGDVFNVYRKSIFYDYQQNPTVELDQTDLVLTVSKVQANSAEGIVNGLTGQSNIQTGDVLISQ